MASGSIGERTDMDEAVKIVRDYIDSALDDPIAYLHITHHTDPKTDPLDVEFFWDEEGFGSLAKVNLGQEYLEVFNEDPQGYAPQMPGVVAALRKLANEIEAIHASVAPNPQKP